MDLTSELFSFVLTRANTEILEDAMMREDLTLSFLQLHVRKSNRVAQSLYNKLGYSYQGVEEKYCRSL